MKKFLLLFLSAILIATPAAVLAGGNFWQADEFVYVSPDQVINSDYFAAGERVEIAGRVDGDVFVAGGVVTISGNVSGDVIAAGGNIQIIGPVQGDVRLAGGNIRISSVVGGSATILGGNVEVTGDAGVGSSLTTLAGAVDIRGTIGRAFRGMVGAVTLASSVGGDVWVKFAEPEQFILTPESNIDGDLVYQGPTTARILTGSTIGGTVNFEPFEELDKRKAKKGIFKFFGFIALIKFLGLLILGVFLLWLVPKAWDEGLKQIQRKFSESILWGILIAILTPAAAIILMMTVVGIVPGVVLLMCYGIMATMGVLLSSYFIGDWLLRSATKRHFRGVPTYASFTLGLFVLFILGAVPIIGWIFNVLAFVTGLGAIVVLKKKYLKNYR